ncbi:ABC transporter permease [Agrococcus sp. Marseille-Q4369]|uniref:ABC transporter permease n=1 Tax=Agrococcus sp. Marseille-Q4369 TaxID=2810513 RepID=UPI001B8BA5BA|nr:ABC transporter permease [Agrococcus sp. Marseille-Q4369]QUW17829.1 ABC transporter permease [Agrococcus sp. Marseille-Q4369]
MLIGAASLALGFLAWLLIANFAGLPSYILPAPDEVTRRFAGLWSSGAIQLHTAQTLAEIIQGAAIGFVIGVVVAITFYKVSWLRKAFIPVLLVIQVTPKISIAPLLVLWMGLGITSKITLVTIAVFFPVMINMLNRLDSIPTTVRDLSRILGFGPIRTALQVEIPFTLPGLALGLKLGLLGGVTAAVVGEFIGSSAGLGYLERQGQDNADISVVFITLGLLALIGLCFYLLVEAIERRLTRRYQ